MDNPDETCENEASTYDYIQMCYMANDIPLELLEDVWPSVEFLIDAVVAYTQPSDTTNDDQFECKLSYNFYGLNAHILDDQFEQVDNASDISDEDDECKNTDLSENEEEQIEDPSDGLDIDRILAEEIKRLNVSFHKLRTSTYLSFSGESSGSEKKSAKTQQ
jgi:formylmethanofuran dehydrogenase subunit E-like metal-binding protein